MDEGPKKARIKTLKSRLDDQTPEMNEIRSIEAELEFLGENVKKGIRPSIETTVTASPVIEAGPNCQRATDAQLEPSLKLTNLEQEIKVLKTYNAHLKIRVEVLENDFANLRAQIRGLNSIIDDEALIAATATKNIKKQVDELQQQIVSRQQNLVSINR